MPENSLISRLKRLARRSRPVADLQNGRLQLVSPALVDQCTMDIVVKSALEKGILTPRDLSQPSLNGGLAIDWRTVCQAIDSNTEQDVPKRADIIRRFAADVYGFQPIIICQIGTLVLGHMLKRRISPKVWRECFRLDCLPVAPYGRPLSSGGRLMLASPDPGRAAVRNLSRSVIPGESTLVYADADITMELKSLLASELPHVSAALPHALSPHAASSHCPAA